jgi:hypothetical protein
VWPSGLMLVAPLDDGQLTSAPPAVPCVPCCCVLCAVTAAGCWWQGDAPKAQGGPQANKASLEQGVCAVCRVRACAVCACTRV